MRRSREFILLAVVLALAASSSGLAGESSTFDRITPHYEEIRQALLRDSTEKVAVAAGQVLDLLQALEADFSEQAAGIRPDSGYDLRALLPSIRQATSELIEATTIADAREAFGALSKAMVQYRQWVPEPGSVVAFCSMAQEVWLQPQGEIGNPYYGQSMARCGEIVSE
jgi:Cu(I)/Ag(I) efflux system membrane fusion protein